MYLYIFLLFGFSPVIYFMGASFFLRWALNTVKSLVVCMKLTILLYAACIVYTLTITPPCSDEEALLAIDKLCSDVLQGNVFGNLCRPLCETLDISYSSCTNQGGEKDVFYVSWDNITTTSRVHLVMKRARFSEILATDLLSSGTEHDLEKRVLMKVERLVNQNLQKKSFKTVHDVLRLFWTMEKNVPLGSRKSDVLRNLYGLALQKEFMLNLLYQNDDVFPQLHGSCGLFYFVERMPSTLNDVGVTWSARASVALKLLDLAHQLNYSFYGKLHVCDIKEGNLGVTSSNHNNSVKVHILDADSVVLNDILVNEMSTRHCVYDADCAEGNCRSVCDIKVGRCQRQRINTNLQVICQQIFSDSDANDHHGLLRHPPFVIRKGLKEILHDCISIQNVDDTDENTALHEMKIIHQIRNLLLKSLSKHTV